MSRVSAVSQTVIKNLLRAFESIGRPILGAKLFPDGSLVLLSSLGEADQPLAAAAAATWTDFVGEQGRAFDA